jgi:transposase
METIRDRVAGLDVHRDTVAACVRLTGPRGVERDRARFPATQAGLAQLAAWLADHEVTTVAMEATGVYWKPVFYTLEGRFPEVQLYNARHVRNVPGRKTDMTDAEWLADVVAHGMARPSVVPPEPVRELRELTRYRKALVDERTREVQRLEKVLQDAGIKLTSVASKLLTASGRAIVEALVAGERDPARLAQLAKGRMRAKIPQLIEALAGRFRAPHATLARHVLDHIDFLDRSIAELDRAILEATGPFEEDVALLATIPGWGRRTAEVFLAETGGDMSRFPTAAHLASWAGVAPANHESAGRHRPAGTRAGRPWLRRALVEAARAGARSRGSYFRAQYATIARRRGPNKAAVAVAHAMVVAAWHILTTRTPYRDLGPDHLIRRDPAREVERLVRRLSAHGYRVTIERAA